MQQWELDALSIQVATLVKDDCSAYVYSGQYPNMRGCPKYWLDLLDYIKTGTPLPGERRVCGVYTPDYAGVVALAREAADTLDVAYLDTDDAPTVCQKIVGTPAT
jgi:hypothetical protein